MHQIMTTGISNVFSTSAMVLVHNSLSINGDYLGKVPYDIYN